MSKLQVLKQSISEAWSDSARASARSELRKAGLDVNVRKQNSTVRKLLGE